MPRLMIIAAAALAALPVLAVPAVAADFDNGTCQTFLVGSWLHTDEHGKHKVTMAVNLNEDGTASFAVTSDPPNPKGEGSIEGTWVAGRGDNFGSCRLTMDRPSLKDQWVTEVPVIDDNTINIPSDSGAETLFTRKAAE